MVKEMTRALTDALVIFYVLQYAISGFERAVWLGFAYFAVHFLMDLEKFPE